MTTNTICEEDIAQYLLETPDFFARHASLLARVQLVHPHNGRTISLADRKLELHRERLHQLEQKYITLLHLGKENVELARKLHQWVVGLLAYREEPHLEVKIEQLCSSLAAIFNIPKVTIDRSPKSMQALSRLHAAVCGTTAVICKNHQIEAPTSQSMAVAPLHGLGLLMLTSDDPTRFTQNMDTEFLTRVAEITHAALYDTPNMVNA